MLHRCRNPKASNYEHYGARGVMVCKRWDQFTNFLKDMGQSFRPGLTLERIDNHKGYSKANCRWVTYKEQNRNYRRNVMLDTPWGRLCLKDAAQRAGMGWPTLRNRIHAGWHPSAWFIPVEHGGDRLSSQAQAEQRSRR